MKTNLQFLLIILFNIEAVESFINLIAGKSKSYNPKTYILVTTGTMTTQSFEASLQRAKEWIQYDPNQKTRNHISALIEKSKSDPGAKEEIEKLFPSDGSRIGFGTAGLRSAMKCGPKHMNDLVIIQTTQGIARHCQQEFAEKGKDKKLLAVIGYDHRANPDLDLSSKSFAILAKMAFLEAGFDCVLLDGYIATPILAYAITKLDAVCGVSQCITTHILENICILLSNTHKRSWLQLRTTQKRMLGLKFIGPMDVR